MNLLQAMRVFLKVAEVGSFGRAAAGLDLSNAVVTRYVALLEGHLNTRLLHRTTRNVALTDAGRDYAEGCRAVLEQVESIELAVSRSAADPAGTLKLIASASFSLDGLTPLLRAYRDAYPKVKVRLTLLHRQIDLVDEGFDAGIIVPRLLNSGTLVQRPLLRIKPVLVASPAYLAAHGHPLRPAALKQHALLAPSPDGHGSTWTFRHASTQEESIVLDPAYTANNAQMLRQAALSDMGIAVLPESHVAHELATGALERVLAAYPLKDADKEVSLVYPGRRHVPAKTRSFVDFTVDYFRGEFVPEL